MTNNELPKLCGAAFKEAGELGLARLVVDNEEIYQDFHKKEKKLIKPEMLVAYENKELAQKMEFDKQYPDWRNRCGADVYESQSVSIALENESNLLHLIRYKDLLSGDMERQIKIKELIEEYEPNEITRVKKEFEGRVVERGYLYDN